MAWAMAAEERRACASKPSDGGADDGDELRRLGRAAIVRQHDAEQLRIAEHVGDCSDPDCATCWRIFERFRKHRDERLEQLRRDFWSNLDE